MPMNESMKPEHAAGMPRADEAGGRHDAPVSYGGLFCRTGAEQTVVAMLRESMPEVRAIAPVKVRTRRFSGAAVRERVALFPGYVFFRAASIDVSAINRLENVLRLLVYPGGDWRMTGYDEQFVRMLFETDGEIGLSTAYFDEGDRIHIMSGFLKTYEGSIKRVNRRAKTAEVSVKLHGKLFSLWLGFELIEKIGGVCAGDGK